MNSVENFAFTDRIAHLAKEIDAGPLFHRRSGKAGDAGDHVTVDARNPAIVRRVNLVVQRSHLLPDGLGTLSDD